MKALVSLLMAAVAAFAALEESTVDVYHQGEIVWVDVPYVESEDRIVVYRNGFPYVFDSASGWLIVNGRQSRIMRAKK